MIGHFPTPYPDELFYSICARFDERMRYPEYYQSAKVLVSEYPSGIRIDLPNNLNHLIAALPPGHRFSVDQLIDQHTFLPFYSPFLAADRCAALRHQMMVGNRRTMRSHLPPWERTVALPAWFKVCWACIDDDRARFGECYWHRVHQVPGVQVCPLHLTWLHNTDVPLRRLSGTFCTAEKAIGGLDQAQVQRPSSLFKPCLEYAREVAWLLAHGRDVPYDPHLDDRYRGEFVRQGYLSFPHCVFQRDALTVAFRQYYSAAFLELVQSSHDDYDTQDWLQNLLPYRLAIQHPLQHLLLVQFLGYTLNEFLALPSEFNPFGTGPWPCLNPTCKHYRQLRVTECDVSYEFGPRHAPIGTFTCVCGFAYSRSRADAAPGNEFRRRQIIAYGPVWEDALRALWYTPGVPPLQMAALLGVTLPTVKRRAARLGLPPRPTTPRGPKKGKV